jgi:CelD/BcsL family acetyltransferase involved in cellulose biosynthesis
MERKVQLLHKLTYTAAHGGKDIEPLIQDFVAVEQRSWKYTAGLDIGFDRAYRDFYRDLLTADSAALQGHALVQYFDGHPSAATLGFSSDSVYYSLQIAHDSEFDALSPGTLLEAAEMQWFFDEPSFTTYEFLGGDGPNKRRWTSTSLETNTQIIARTGYRSALARNHLFHIRPALTRLSDRKTKSS